MSKELEAFINDVKKAIKSIPSRPSIILKNADIVGIKLNSKSLKQLESEVHSQNIDFDNLHSLEYLSGIRIYKDESIDVPRYIVIGEIELNNASYSEALNITKATEKYTGIDLSIVIQALLKAQEQENVLKELIANHIEFVVEQDRCYFKIKNSKGNEKSFTSYTMLDFWKEVFR